MIRPEGHRIECDRFLVEPYGSVPDPGPAGVLVIAAFVLGAASYIWDWGPASLAEHPGWWAGGAFVAALVSRYLDRTLARTWLSVDRQTREVAVRTGYMGLVEWGPKWSLDPDDAVILEIEQFPEWQEADVIVGRRKWVSIGYPETVEEARALAERLAEFAGLELVEEHKVYEDDPDEAGED